MAVTYEIPTDNRWVFPYYQGYLFLKLFGLRQLHLLFKLTQNKHIISALTSAVIIQY
ncbi:hypothetical protein EZS27_024596 [termite gut metagenome]|uniref:Uncharacterized protein n=1 Tax=termite gut metagenome TaxID=433724 RepID=A0A5J4R0L0_9ZZZZ